MQLYWWRRKVTIILLTVIVLAKLREEMVAKALLSIWTNGITNQTKSNEQKQGSENLGFSGDDDDYYNPKNNFLNEVIDKKTGLPIVSLYGKNKKPTTEQFSDLDVVIFDRFATSSLDRYILIVLWSSS